MHFLNASDFRARTVKLSVIVKDGAQQQKVVARISFTFGSRMGEFHWPEGVAVRCTTAPRLADCTKFGEYFRWNSLLLRLHSHVLQLFDVQYTSSILLCSLCPHTVDNLFIRQGLENGIKPVRVCIHCLESGR